MKLTFTCDHTAEEHQFGAISSGHYEPVYPKVSMEFEATSLHAIFIEFRHFLLACGYVIEGEIGELEPEEYKSGETSGTKAVNDLRKDIHHGGSDK